MNQVRAVFSDIELCAYLDGEMPSERRVEIDAWLGSHPEARAKLQAWRRQEHQLRASFGRIAQEPLPRQMMAALLQQTAPTKITPITQAPPRNPAPSVVRGEPALLAPAPASAWRNAGLAALGVSAVVAVVAFGAMQQTGAHLLANRGEPLALATSSVPPGFGLTQHATEAHVAFASRADKLLDVRSADPAVLTAAAVQAGLDARLPGAVAGLRTFGLRLTPSDSGIAGVLLFDTDKNGRVSLFVARSGRGSAPGLILRESNGLTIASFHVDGVTYALTGAASRDQMVDWASALRMSLVQPRSLRGS